MVRAGVVKIAGLLQRREGSAIATRPPELLTHESLEPRRHVKVMV